MTDGTLPLPWFRLSPESRSFTTDARTKGGDDRLAYGVSGLESEDSLLGLSELVTHANDAATFLKALGHDGRLTILCHLLSGPKSVTELENLLSARQAVVSQQLARLRLEGIVSARREGQAIFYSILDPKVVEVLSVLSKLFCKPTE